MIAARKFRTPAARKRAHLRLAVRVIAIVAVIVTVGVSLVYAVRAPQGRVSKVEVVTDGSLPIEELRSHVENKLAGSILKLIPRDSILVVSTDSIADALRQQYPPIRVVNVERRSLRALAVAIEERQPKAMWCGDVVPDPVPFDTAASASSTDVSWESCYLMDGDAYLYASARATDDQALPRFYGSLERAEPIGQSFVTPVQFVAYVHLYNLAREAGFDPRAVLMTDDSDGELYLRAYRVLFARADSVDELWNRFDATVHSRVIDETRPMQYVDMRFGTKVYVKYIEPEATEESQGSVVTSTSTDGVQEESTVRLQEERAILNR